MGFLSTTKILRPLLATFFLAGVAFALVSLPGQKLTASVFGGGGLDAGLQAAKNELSNTGIRPDTDLVAVTVSIINATLPYVALLVIVAFVVAGFIFILGFGSDTANQRAKKIMIWSAVGLIVILFAFIITNFIIQIATA